MGGRQPAAGSRYLPPPGSCGSPRRYCCSPPPRDSVLRAPWWWYPALPGVLLSQGLIVTAWGDAKFGTLANVIIAIPLLVAALDARPSSFRSRFEHDRDALLAGATPAAAPVTEADLAPLPPLMQAYLRRMGAVGRRARAQHARDLQRANAQQRDGAVDAGHRHAVRVLRSARHGCST